MGGESDPMSGGVTVPKSGGGGVQTRSGTPTIPEIRLRGAAALKTHYDTTQQAMDGIATLKDFYQQTYPDFYAAHSDQVTAAIAAIQDIDLSTFTDQFIGMREKISELLKVFNETGSISESILSQIGTGLGSLGTDIQELIRRWLVYKGLLLADQVGKFLQALRARPLAKPPGVAETLDWTRALLTLHRDALDTETVEQTLGCVLKDRNDQTELAQADLTTLVAAAQATE